METAEHREPCKSRGLRTVLGAPGGETPLGDSPKYVREGGGSGVRTPPDSEKNQPSICDRSPASFPWYPTADNAASRLWTLEGRDIVWLTNFAIQGISDLFTNSIAGLFERI